jgi:hypothetical protein
VTKQIIEQNPPLPEDKQLAIEIVCLNCMTHRTFQLGATLKLLLQRKSNSFTIETECYECGWDFGATVGWVEDKEGYSGKRIANADSNCIVVEDEVALTKDR